MVAPYNWRPQQQLPGSIMDGGRVSDHSMEHILSPQLRFKLPMDFSPDQYLQGFHHGFSRASGSLRPPAPVRISVPSYRQYRKKGFGEVFYPFGAGFRYADFNIHSNSGVFVHISNQESADSQQLPGYHGYCQAGVPAQSQPRQKSRMRTVFTDSQTKKLEALFELTNYPTVEARAELARSSGLREDTVRVWFKNRRARRKRQSCGSKVKGHSAGGDRKL